MEKEGQNQTITILQHIMKSWIEAIIVFGWYHHKKRDSQIAHASYWKYTPLPMKYFCHSNAVSLYSSLCSSERFPLYLRMALLLYTQLQLPSQYLLCKNVFDDYWIDLFIVIISFQGRGVRLSPSTFCSQHLEYSLILNRH